MNTPSKMGVSDKEFKKINENSNYQIKLGNKFI